MSVALGPFARLARPTVRRRREAVEAPKDRGVRDALGSGGHGVVLVVEGQVIEDVLARVEHPTQPFADDDRRLVGEGRVVDLAVRDRRRDQQAVPVLVLESLAVERRPAGRGAQQEASATGIAEGPQLVADALEAEHRVEDVEGHHRLAVGRVAGASGLEAGRRARLCDALLEHLPVLRLAVAEHEGGIDGLVELAVSGIDAGLLEERLHAERPRLVRHDGHDPSTRAPCRASGSGAAWRRPSWSRPPACPSRP